MILVCHKINGIVVVLCFFLFPVDCSVPEFMWWGCLMIHFLFIMQYVLRLVLQTIPPPLSLFLCPFSSSLLSIFLSFFSLYLVITHLFLYFSIRSLFPHYTPLLPIFSHTTRNRTTIFYKISLVCIPQLIIYAMFVTAYKVC